MKSKPMARAVNALGIAFLRRFFGVVIGMAPFEFNLPYVPETLGSFFILLNKSVLGIIVEGSPS